MRRRDLLAAAPAVAAGVILPTETKASTLIGLPLAAHYGELAGEALLACEWSHHFDMEVRQGEVWFHNRHDPREAIAHHFRMIRREAAKVASLPHAMSVPETDRWLVAYAKTIYGIDLS